MGLKPQMVETEMFGHEVSWSPNQLLQVLEKKLATQLYIRWDHGMVGKYLPACLP